MVGQTPDWIRKAAIAAELAALLPDPDGYLTREFGLQPQRDHISAMADRLFALATEDGPEGETEAI
jgi:hypothetical protein